MRQVGIAILIAGGMVTLTGCDPLPPSSDWAIRIAGDAMWFAPCEAAQGGSIGGDVERSTGPRWTEFWEVSGDLDFTRGDVIHAGQDYPGIDTQDFDAGQLADAEGVVLYLYRSGAEVKNAGFDVPAGYNGDGWLRVDGSVTAEPCGTDPE